MDLKKKKSLKETVIKSVLNKCVHWKLNIYIYIHPKNIIQT